MDVELSARHFELTDTVRNYIDRKVGRLDRYLPDIKATRVELSRVSTRSMGEVYAAQVTAWVDGSILRAEEVNGDLYAAIDLSADKIHRQIERYKGKRHRRYQARPDEEAEESAEEVVPEEDPAQVVRRKRFELYPMTEAEAIDQLELLGHDFFMFLNAQTGHVNVMYRRRDGHMGLLEPEHV
jgi:putative sigma-54 modulation protein